jgi:hypothetical protein
MPLLLFRVGGLFCDSSLVATIDVSRYVIRVSPLAMFRSFDPRRCSHRWAIIVVVSIWAPDAVKQRRRQIGKFGLAEEDRRLRVRKAVTTSSPRDATR